MDMGKQAGKRIAAERLGYCCAGGAGYVLIAYIYRHTYGIDNGNTDLKMAMDVHDDVLVGVWERSA